MVSVSIKSGVDYTYCNSIIKIDCSRDIVYEKIANFISEHGRNPDRIYINITGMNMWGIPLTIRGLDKKANINERTKDEKGVADASKEI